jgi:hypothetical protein
MYDDPANSSLIDPRNKKKADTITAHGDGDDDDE